MVSVQAEKLDPAAAADRRILIVDDYRSTAESLAKWLRHLGHEVRVAFDGFEGIAVAEKFRPDIVFLDISMPKMTGYEAAERIRRQPWGKQMMLVALTGWGEEQHRKLSLKAGFDAHLVKPIVHAKILALLVTLVNSDVGSSSRNR